MDGFERGWVLLVVNERFHIIFLGETLDQSFAVLVDPKFEVAGHADIQRAPWFAGEDVDEELFFQLVSREGENATERKLGHPDKPGDDGS